jgi:VIT1/CCC1 family predicted Fe2+/Mn2+ transporter
MPQLAPDVTWKYTAHVEKADGSTSTVSGYVSAMNTGIASSKVSSELTGAGLTVRRIHLVKA